MLVPKSNGIGQPDKAIAMPTPRRRGRCCNWLIHRGRTPRRQPGGVHKSGQMSDSQRLVVAMSCPGQRSHSIGMSDYFRELRPQRLLPGRELAEGIGRKMCAIPHSIQVIFTATRCSRNSSSVADIQPRGIDMYCSKSSAQEMIRGVIAVDKRIRCFL
jgi:hypothetical protein